MSTQSPPLSKKILLNAFDMSTIGHLSPGQWKRPEDRSTTKRTLEYWTNLAHILERGGINALFLADTYGGYDTYQGSLDECIRRAAQWPVTDPTIPISAMAAVTKNLTFGITASTSFEPPFLLAKRFSTLDHLTSGRIAWNIVTSWKKAAFKAIGLPEPIAHDDRYAQADEYLQILYKLWESSWADDAIVADKESDTYFDPAKVKSIKHNGPFFSLDSRHIVDPSPQRTPFLFQAGTSPAGTAFASRHAEAIFISTQTPPLIAPKISSIRAAAAAAGRDPQSVKFFVSLTPVLAKTDQEAATKFAKYQKTASVTGALVLLSGWTGIDLSKFPRDHVLTAEDSKEVHKVTSSLNAFSPGAQEWTPDKIGEAGSIGGLGPVVVGSPKTVADELERWVREADVDGFNLGYVVTPGSFEDIVNLLVPELRRRGIYSEAKDDGEKWTAREKVYGRGQKGLRDDHAGAKFKYDVYWKEQEQKEKAEDKAE